MALSMDGELHPWPRIFLAFLPRRRLALGWRRRKTLPVTHSLPSSHTLPLLIFSSSAGPWNLECFFFELAFMFLEAPTALSLAEIHKEH